MRVAWAALCLLTLNGCSHYGYGYHNYGYRTYGYHHAGYNGGIHITHIHYHYH